MFDIPRIFSETPVRRIEYHADLPSTNDFALQQLRADDLGELPLLVLADRQTRGRGRGENRWWSSEGALTFSLVLPLDPQHLPLDRRPLLALAAGLAVRDALEDVVQFPVHGFPEMRLKWPNDVFLNDRKVCGILIELPARPSDVCVVGIGVNVNNSFDAAPPEIRQRAVSVAEHLAAACDLTAVLIGILQHFDRTLQTLVQRPETVVARWQTFCMLTGRQVCLQTEAQRTIGRCEGIDAAGRLILQTERGTQTFASGTVELMQHKDEFEQVRADGLS
jgi:BirA family transcriptional regulator, biotin operon repressor / biotin---[acetyl-CoA-carboxylase] ligase